MARTDPRYAGHLGGPNMRSPGHIVSVELPSIFGEVDTLEAYFLLSVLPATVTRTLQLVWLM